MMTDPSACDHVAGPDGTAGVRATDRLSAPEMSPGGPPGGLGVSVPAECTTVDRVSFAMVSPARERACTLAFGAADSTLAAMARRRSATSWAAFTGWPSERAQPRTCGGYRRGPGRTAVRKRERPASRPTTSPSPAWFRDRPIPAARARSRSTSRRRWTPRAPGPFPSSRLAHWGRRRVYGGHLLHQPIQDRHRQLRDHLHRDRGLRQQDRRGDVLTAGVELGQDGGVVHMPAHNQLGEDPVPGRGRRPRVLRFPGGVEGDAFTAGAHLVDGNHLRVAHGDPDLVLWVVTQVRELDGDDSVRIPDGTPPLVSQIADRKSTRLN